MKLNEVGETGVVVLPEGVAVVFDKLSPFFGTVAVVECGVGDGVADDEAHGFAALGEHFGREECHLEVEFEAEAFAETCDVVETFAVAGVEEEGDDVALVADSFFDEGGFPFEVANLAVLLFARADAGGEVEKAVLACESVFEGVDVGSVAVYFVDGDKEGCGAGEVEEEVVDGKFDVLTVSANGGHNGKAIGTAEGMVASDNGVAFFRYVVRVDDYNFGIQVAGVVAFKKGMDEVESELVTVTVDG